MHPAPADLLALADLRTPTGAWQVSAVDDEALLDLQRDLGEIRRRVDAAAATVAAEVAHRSRRELGYQGLAQRLGDRTPELLIQRVGGVAGPHARMLVRVGELMQAAAGDPLSAAGGVPAGDSRWLEHVGEAVRGGALSLDAAEAIRSGLGDPDDRVTASDLSIAAGVLLDAAGTSTVRELGRRARELRDSLDSEGVVDRERERRARRYLRFLPAPDGMTRVAGLLDPESAAIVISAYDSATSPRRGGPRFADAARASRAEALLRDERTTEQLAVDTLVELVRLGGRTDEHALLGGRPPAVQLLVTDADLRARRGAGQLEGGRGGVSIATVDRVICEAGIVPIHFDDDGQVVNVGRDQRLFTRRQRVGLAARDGGCRFPGCERPPSWCEAHHIEEWHRDRGRTDIADGILLCRHHHLLVHDNGWKVRRNGADYSLIPPESLDPGRTPIPAPTKSPGFRRLVAVS